MARPKKDRFADHLSLDALAASTAGMSYGIFKAFNPVTFYPQTELPQIRKTQDSMVGVCHVYRPCQYCGDIFETTARSEAKYCSEICRNLARARRWKKEHKQ